MKISSVTLAALLLPVVTLTAGNYGDVIEELLSDPNDAGPSLLVDGDLVVGDETAPSHSIDTVLYGGLSVIGNPTLNVVVFGEYTSEASNGMPEGDGRRLVWHTGKSAFRVGKVFDGSWDNSEIGDFSIGMGRNVKATAYNTFAVGEDARATDLRAIAIGNAAWATGDRSIALGTLAKAEGPKAFALFGSEANAPGDGQTTGYSIAMGLNSEARNSHVIALGHNNYAGGLASFAINEDTIATGSYLFASGSGTNANAYASFAIGQYNVGGFSSTSGDTAWDDADPLFEIGIGDDDQNRANALTIYKDGKAEFSGAVMMTQAQGDIDMGTYGN
ncbi:hypothetical protein [Cerasicoccus arenae]|uniref:Trimeric autotransporter adhesin YadA-like head domain-containing protein n=1 Tax=Cerasicoccus arenae TaxID=424488 RepID=A0A8J3D704_9BACT|nr:hypothetical protein [Cerasicoccus arenae]MBK1857703.1 hypothetical protein [Cerasicoccus arenae]GHB91265.1 hypothetical protein GCM10007047_02890 [Cerasicoccus arenae]